MPLLRPPLHTESIYVSGPQGGHRYAVASDGLIHNVAADDLLQLLEAGCEPTEPAPPPAEPARVRLKGKAYMVYAPKRGSTVRYTADGEGHLYAAPEHVQALLRAGCSLQ